VGLGDGGAVAGAAAVGGLGARLGVVIAGRSVAGRALELHDVPGRDGDARVGAFVFGAIHGDEPAAAELCRRFLAALALDPPATRTLVLPVANPDGLARNHKDNDHGVDLNRNFDARNWRREHPPGYDPGAAPLSEPESAALAALIAAHDPPILVAVHQPFRCVNWDGSGAALAAAMARACGYPAVASVGYPTPGSFGSRYGVDEGRAVITFELPRPMPDADWEPCLRALRCATIVPGRP
jgi:protein MpaA